MPDVAFCWLSDIERRVLEAVNQPKDRRGVQPTWSQENLTQAYNRAYKALYRKISNMDIYYQQTQVDVTIATGSQTYALPTRTSSLRLAMVMTNGRADWPIERGRAEDIGQFVPGRKAIFIPDQNILYFTTPLTSPLTVRLFYGSYYTPLVHSEVVAGGGATAQLSPWNPIESNIYTGLPLIVSEGTGIGQERTAGVYNGATKTLTVTQVWATVPDNTSFISCRPDLPLWAEDVYENMIVAILYEKTAETQKIKEARAFVEDAFRDFQSQLKMQERREPATTLDTNLNGGWTDPAYMFNW